MTSPDAPYRIDDRGITTVLPKLSASALAQLVGAELQDAVNRMQTVMDAYIEHRSLNDVQAQSLYLAIGDARELATRSALLGRLARHEPSGEATFQAIDELLIHTLDTLAGELDERGVGVSSMVKPAYVMADPAVLADLIRSVVVWCTSVGAGISFGTDLAGEDGHAVLFAKITPAPDDADIPKPMRDSVGWLLITQLCEALQANASRAVLAGLERKQAADNGRVELVVHFQPLPEGVTRPLEDWET